VEVQRGAAVTLSSARRACVSCGEEMVPLKNGVQIHYAHGGTTVEHAADTWQCPRCGFSIITGFGEGLQGGVRGTECFVKSPVEMDGVICYHCSQEMEILAPVSVLEMAEFGPYKLWTARLHKCSSCGGEVVVVVNQVSEHYLPDFKARVAEAWAGRIVVVR